MPEEQETRLERVYTASGQFEAHVIKGKLEKHLDYFFHLIKIL